MHARRTIPLFVVPLVLGSLTLPACASDEPADDETPTGPSGVFDSVPGGVQTTDRVEEGGNLGFDPDEEG